MALRKFGNHVVIEVGALQLKDGPRFISGTAFPKSGTAGTGYDFQGGAGKGSIFLDETSGCAFVNEHTAASPYWTPISFDQRGMLGWYSDFTKCYSITSPFTEAAPNTFTEGLGKAIADTRTTKTLTDGIRVHGQGINEVDSGLTVAFTATDGKGATASLITTDEDAHVACLSVGAGTTPVFQADQNGTYVVDALISNSDDLLTRGVFVGFCGSAADALDPIMTYSGTTISFATTIGDDVAGLAFSSELTAASRWFAPHDKANTNASIATSATGVDTGVDVAAAGTYQRMRVECDPDGAVRMFIDKAQVASFAAGCLDTDEEMHPMVYIESTDAATKTLLLRHFGAWGARA